MTTAWCPTCQKRQDVDGESLEYELEGSMSRAYEVEFRVLVLACDHETSSPTGEQHPSDQQQGL